MKIHPRYWIVTEAKIALDMASMRIEKKYDLSITKTLDILFWIASETNKVSSCVDRKISRKGYSPAAKELLDIVEDLEKKHELTPAESIKNLLERAETVNLYSIRLDRHPNDPDKRGDEA